MASTISTADVAAAILAAVEPGFQPDGQRPSDFQRDLDLNGVFDSHAKFARLQAALYIRPDA